jgi:hypothetical protein
MNRLPVLVQGPIVAAATVLTIAVSFIVFDTAMMAITGDIHNEKALLAAILLSIGAGIGCAVMCRS